MPFIPTSKKPTAGFVPTGTTSKRDTRPLSEVLAEGDKAKDFLGKSAFGQLFSKETGEELKKGAKDFFLGTLPRAFTRVKATIQETPDLLKEKKLSDVLNPFVSPSALAEKEGDVKTTGKEYQPWFSESKVKSYYSKSADIIKDLKAEAEGSKETYEVFGKEIPIGIRLSEPLVQAAMDLILLKGATETTIKGATKIKEFVDQKMRIKEIDKAVHAIQPKFTDTQIKDRATRGGTEMVDGKVGMSPESRKEVEIAEEVLKEIDYKDPAKTIYNINKEGTKLAQDMGNQLTDSKINVDKNELIDEINNMKPKEWIKGNEVTKPYNTAKEWMIRKVQEAKDMDLKELWNFRTYLDREYEKQFGGNAWNTEKFNAAKDAYDSGRTIINNYIGAKFGNKDFLETLRRLHLRHEAVKNFATRIPEIYGMKGAELFWKNHPNLDVTFKTIGNVTKIVGSAVGLNFLYKGLRGLTD